MKKMWKMVFQIIMLQVLLMGTLAGCVNVPENENQQEFAETETAQKGGTGKIEGTEADQKYPTFTIESDTTEEISYEVNLNGIRDLIIRFECHAVDSGFCGGIIFEDK